MTTLSVKCAHANQERRAIAAHLSAANKVIELCRDRARAAVEKIEWCPTPTAAAEVDCAMLELKIARQRQQIISERHLELLKLEGDFGRNQHD